MSCTVCSDNLYFILKLVAWDMDLRLKKIKCEFRHSLFLVLQIPAPFNYFSNLIDLVALPKGKE